MSLLFSKRSGGSPFPEPIVPAWPGMGSVSGDAAMRLDAVWACVRLLSDTVSMLPLNAMDVGKDLTVPPRVSSSQPGWLGNPFDDLTMGEWLRRDVAAACGYFMELVQSGRLAHLGQDDLTESVMAARTKTVGESAIVWVRNGLASLAPTYAASLAAWQVNVGADPALNVW